jgi:hypothetical protein
MLKKITDHTLVPILCGVSLAFVLGGFIWFIAATHAIASPLILHFNSTAGVTQVGDFGAMFGIGILAILVMFLNVAITIELSGRNRFLGIFAAGITLVLAVLLFVAAAAIIGVN